MVCQQTAIVICSDGGDGSEPVHATQMTRKVILPTDLPCPLEELSITSLVSPAYEFYAGFIRPFLHCTFDDSSCSRAPT